MDFSLAQLVKVTGGKRRSVQLWAEAAAILAYPTTEKRGTGTHRKFSRVEAIIACVLNALAKRQVGIGELVRIGRGIRAFLNSGKSRVELEEILNRKAEWNFFLVIIWKHEGDPEVSLNEEPELSPLIGDNVKDDGLSIILPLRRALEGLMNT
jgi:hypothetical protein